MVSHITNVLIEFVSNLVREDYNTTKICLSSQASACPHDKFAGHFIPQ